MTKSKKNRMTLAEANPELVVQWHPTKNGDLTPDTVMRGARKKVWWLFPYDDPKTGKHFDFEWEAKISDRSRGIGCPFLSGKAVWSGYNDLATKCPELAAQWHPTKNEGLTPDKVTCGSNIVKRLQKRGGYVPNAAMNGVPQHLNGYVLTSFVLRARKECPDFYKHNEKRHRSW